MKALINPTQEDWFEIWAEQLKGDYIKELITEPPNFVLFEGLKRSYGKKENTILHTLSYTPDYIIEWTERAQGIFFTPWEAANDQWDNTYFNCMKHPEENCYYSIIDVKGPSGNQRAYNTDFRFTQKWMWQKYNFYVQKVMLTPAKLLKNPKGYLWHDTFTPDRYFLTDKLTKIRTIPSKVGKPLWNVRTMKEFLTISELDS